MADDFKKSGSGDSDNANLVLAAVAGLAATLLLAVPAGLGYGAYRASRAWLGRREYVVALVLGVAAFALTFQWSLNGYLSWLAGLRTPAVGDLLLPLPQLAPLVAITFGASGLLASTGQGRVLANRLLRREEDDSIIPDEKRVQNIPTPPREPSRSSHSIDSHTPGDRTFRIGVDRHGRPFYLSEAEVKTHGVILGSTGSGKTETIKNLAGNLLDLGWSVIMLDLKEDTATNGLRDFCRDYATGHALSYQEIALSSDESPCWFNPLYGMTLDEAINTIISLQTFDDGFWQAINKTMLGQICTLFYNAHAADPGQFGPPDMYSIGKMLKAKSLEKETRLMRGVVLTSVPGRHADDFNSLTNPNDDERKSAAGLGNRITQMFESDAGRRTLRALPGRQVMDVTRPGICYVGLNTLGLSELARVVSTSVLMRVSAYAGARTTGAAAKDDRRIAVIIDEANWVDRKQVQNLLSRARSAGVGVFLCTQGPMDWNDSLGEDWPVITQNVNVNVIMRQGNEESAEMCAALIGKRTKRKLINQVRDGELVNSGTVKEELDYVVKPEEIRLLRVGQSVVKVGVPVQRTAWVKIEQRAADDEV